MTKKHFKALANALASVRPPSGSGAYDGWWEAVLAVAGACAGFNPRFDRERFIEACS